MTSAIAVLVVAAAITWALTPLARSLAVRYGIVAHPCARSVHTSPLPYLGGFAIYAGIVVAAAVGLGVGHGLVRVLALGGGAILLLGAYDDWRPMAAAPKALIELAVAGLTVAAGVRIEWVTHPLGGMFSLGAWGIPVTMLWLVTVTNLVNLIDGLDGLAAGISAIVGLTLFFVCWQAGQMHTALLTAALAGAAAGFLPHNFNPAKIIMGDAGALFLGYVVAVISVEGPIKSATAVALFVPVLALGVPILDAAFAVWRRFSRRRSVVAADREHLHHRLLNLGLTQRQAVLVMYSVSGFFGYSAFRLTEMTVVQAAVLLAGVFSLVLLAARRAGLLGASAAAAAAQVAAAPVAAAQVAAGLDREAGPPA